jgi:hypothetical protein
MVCKTGLKATQHSLLMKFVVAMTCCEADLVYINDCVKSLLAGMIVPEEIIITLGEGTKIPTALRKKMTQSDSRIKLVRVDKDYGSLTAIVGAMERHPVSSDMYIVFLNSNCTYPPHLLKEYEMSIPDLDRGLKEKLPNNNNGSIYGLGGVVMAQDKNANLDREFQKLIGVNDEHYEERNLIGYVRDNATVDYLESCTSLCIHRSLLKNDFLVYLAKVIPSTEEGHNRGISLDIILSNYFAKHQILRLQICNLAINRFMLHRSGYLVHHQEPPEQQKRELFEHTVKYLRKLNSFYAYA